MAARLSEGRSSAPRPTARRGIGPFTARQLAAVVASVLGTAVVVAVLTAPVASTPVDQPVPGSSFYPIAEAREGLRVGDRAPELRGTVDGREVGLVDLDGRPVRLAELRGRPVWINFFATWCPPCQEETPVLQRVYETHEDEGLVVLAISVQETSPEDVRRYVQTYGLTYRVAFDASAAIFHTYRAFGLPTQLFIDREGIIRRVVHGPLREIDAERILAPIILARG